MANIICSYCGNSVNTYQVGVMTVQVAMHQLNNGGPCPGSGQQRSLAR
jgi:hypothetical protein